jgi:hypothetical protein
MNGKSCATGQVLDIAPFVLLSFVVLPVLESLGLCQYASCQYSCVLRGPKAGGRVLQILTQAALAAPCLLSFLSRGRMESLDFSLVCPLTLRLSRLSPYNHLDLVLCSREWT